MTNAATNIKTSRDEKRWEAEISAEITAETISSYYSKALEEIRKEATVDGFRPGKAPAERVLAIYGEGPIMRRAAEMAVQDVLPEILAQEKLPIVETPRVATGTPEKDKPLSFTARASLAPEVKLPDYQKIAEKHRAAKESSDVTDTEHTEALTHLRRERARIDKIESGTEPSKAAEEIKALAEADLPALDDMFVQSLGYENTEAFSEALRENIKNEKEMRAMDKVRAAILDEVVEKATIHYPATLKEYELDDMEARLGADLERVGETMDGYLAHQKKTREEMRASWDEAADKRAKVRLVLAEIARAEKIEPSEADVAHEVMHAKEHYGNVPEETLRAHIAHAMRNEMVVRLLDGSPEPEPHHHEHE